MRTILFYTLLLSLLIGMSCKKNADPFPYAEFRVNGVHKKYEQVTGFSKTLCVSSTYCGHFYSSQQSADLLKIGIPGDPIVGHKYQSGEYRFEVYYLDGSGVQYDMTVAPLFVIFTKWDGTGGWAEGNFSGWLKSSAGDSVYFDDGFFRNSID